MPRLPTVLVTDVIRSTHQGESHGGAYLIDFETGSSTQVLDWDTMDIDWSGRGFDRGLRGIAYHDGTVLIAASDEIMVFDPSFKHLRSFRNRYLRHCHEIHADGDRLFLTSTGFDSVLELDLRTGVFTGARLIRHYPHRLLTDLGPVIQHRLRVGRFDPTRSDGPKPGDTTHVNSVWRGRGRTFVGGVRLDAVHAIDRDGVRPYAPTPPWTHNARPFRDGVLYNSTSENAVCYADLEGNVVRRFAVPGFDSEALLNANIPADHARPGFARGLCATDDGFVIAGCSPTTITVYEFDTGRIVQRVNVSKDVRNCPHGLELWPY